MKIYIIDENMKQYLFFLSKSGIPELNNNDKKLFITQIDLQRMYYIILSRKNRNKDKTKFINRK